MLRPNKYGTPSVTSEPSIAALFPGIPRIRE